jgi:zinc protease
MEIGQLETSGVSYTASQRLIEKLQAVTADQVRVVAQKYFVDDRLTVAELDPQPLPDTPRARGAAPRH